MHLPVTVADLLPTRASYRILSTLAERRGEVFTIRGLARAAGVSHPETSKILARLEGMGVVRLQPVGRAFQVTLNEEGYFVRSAVEPLLKAEESALPELVSTIKPFFEGGSIESAAIFGSVARGDAGRGSDIDLLMVSDDESEAIERFTDANMKVMTKFGVSLSPFVMGRKQLRQRLGIASSVLESYIQVAGKDLRTLAE